MVAHRALVAGVALTLLVTLPGLPLVPPPDASAGVVECVSDSARVAFLLRVSGGIADPENKWPWQQPRDGSLAVSLERTSSLFDALTFDVTLQPPPWRRDGTNAQGRVLAGSLGVRHVLVTDIAVDRPGMRGWFVTPWFGLGAGVMTYYAPGVDVEEADPEWAPLVRLNLGLDLWVAPRLGTFVSWDNDLRHPFHRRLYHDDHALHFGIVVVPADGGLSR